MRPAPTGPAVRVLVVRGDHADQAVLASMALAHKFELLVIESDAPLLDEVRRLRPDAIVLDLVVAGATGYEVCARLKSEPDTAAIPVVLTTTLDGPEARELAYAAGCDEVIEKPINRHLLAHRLRSLARLRRWWLAARVRSGEQP